MKTIILTLLLITALVANGCGNKKNVTDMKDKETTVSAVQQETTQLRTQETTTGLTMDSETQQEETTEEESKTVVATEVTDSSQTVYETAPQVAEPDNNSFAAGYAASSQYSQLVIVQSNGTNATVTMHELQDGVWTEILMELVRRVSLHQLHHREHFRCILHLELIRIRERKFLIFR